MKIDINRHLGLIQREVGVRERDGRETRFTTASRVYDTEIEDVWDAITNPERIPRWFSPVTGDLRLGGRFQIEGNAGGEITECAQPNRLALTWEFGGDTSWVRATLAQVDGGTQLRVEHEGHVPDDFWEQYGPGAGGVGWDLSLVGLAEHLAGGPAIDHKEAELWPASDDGRRFVEHCSKAWCKAAIDAGAAVAAAEAAASRTVAFYTGQEQAPASD